MGAFENATKFFGAYCEWMAVLGNVTAPGASHDLHTSSYDADTRVVSTLVVLLGIDVALGCAW